MVIKRICSWCGRCLGTKECECPHLEGIEDPVTHTICPECMAKALAEIDSAPAENNKPNK